VITSNLSKAHETRDSLSTFYSQVVLIYIYPFRRNSLLKSAPQPQIAKNPLKPLFWGFKVIQGHRMLTLVQSLSLLHVIYKQHVCGCLQLFSRYTNQ